MRWFALRRLLRGGRLRGWWRGYGRRWQLKRRIGLTQSSLRNAEIAEKRKMSEKIKKATRHTNQNEGLIFEKSSPGKRAFELPPLDVPVVDPAKSLGAHHRSEGVTGFPAAREIEVLRHFTRLSTWNYAIDLGM